MPNFIVFLDAGLCGKMVTEHVEYEVLPPLVLSILDTLMVRIDG